MRQTSCGAWSSGDVLVVPPMEAVWLTGSELQFQDGRGCLSFEVKADNDATVLLKQHTGSRRWQHLTAGVGAAQRAAADANSGQALAPGRSSPVEQNYTVILGSHRNSCLKFEKDGELCCMVPCAPDVRLSGSTFLKYWINYDRGMISVGMGQPGQRLCYAWSDPDPIEGIRFAGLSAWDKHVGYRNLRMHPVLAPPPPRSPSLPQSRPAERCDDDAPAAKAAATALPSLLQLCQLALLRGLSAGTVCDLLQVLECLSPVGDVLQGPAVQFAAEHLSTVVGQDPDGFCALSTACLAEILRSPSLDCPEMAVFNAVMLWAGYGREVVDAASPCHPLRDLEELLPCIRFPLMRDAELEAVKQHAMHGRSPLLQELVREALDARTGDDQAAPQMDRAQSGPMSLQDKRHVRALTASEKLASSRFQLRRAPGCTELLYMFDGDTNGVTCHLATHGGSQPWVNPVLSGRLKIRASSPACRSTDPKALAGNNFARCNFAGPRLEDGHLSSWWLMDLGPEHCLICNHYTLRHDGSTDFLRSWVLQGSEDGTNWADLRRHISDRTIRMPGQYASWAVGSHAAAVAYRFFRLLLVGPNPESSNPHHMCLSRWELYGYLYRRQKHGTPDSDAAIAS